MSVPVRRKLLGVGAGVAFLSACGRQATVMDGASVQSNNVTTDMRTHCLGRLLLDLPSDFELTSGSDVELVYGLDKNFRTVKVKAPQASGGKAAFERMVEARALDLAGQHHFKAESHSMLVSNKRIAEGTALVRSFDNPDSLVYFNAEVFALKQDAIGHFDAEIFKDDRPEDIEAKLLRAAEKTTAIASAQSAGRGTCLGPLLIDAEQDGEWFTVLFLSKRWPDVHVQVFINSTIAESDGGLLKRWDSKQGQLAKLGFKSDTLRRGPVGVGGRRAEELLSEGTDGGKIIRGFDAETLLTSPSTLAAPHITISAMMGGQRNGIHYSASWSREESMAIWDTIVKSVRTRPGAL